MPKFNPNPSRSPYRWVVKHRPGRATVVLPDGLDLGGAVEVPSIGDRFARFILPDGSEIDCAVYAREMENEARAPVKPEPDPDPTFCPFCGGKAVYFVNTLVAQDESPTGDNVTELDEYQCQDCNGRSFWS